jgi:hypothetical protein
MKRARWTRLSDSRLSKCDQRWRHDSGYEVRHCGHPTALWPWYVIAPAAPELCLVAEHGHAFRLLAEAMDAAEGLAAGRLAAMETPLSPSHVRRVVGVVGVSP